MKPFYPGIGREDALRELNAFIAELDAGWERDRLYWAPALLALLRSLSAEASKEVPDSERLQELRMQIQRYFEVHRCLKGICFVLEWVAVIAGHENS